MIGFPQTVYPTNRCKWPKLKEKKEKKKKEKTTKKRTNNKGKEKKEETPEEKAEREKHELETKAKKQRLQKAKKAGSVIINWSYVFKSGFFQQVLPIPKWSRDERPLTRPLKNAKIRTTWMINGKKCLDLGLRILFKAPAWLLISTGDKRYNPITHGTSSQAWQYARSIHQGPEGGGRLDCGQTDGFAGSFGSEQGLFWGLCVVDSLLGPISYLKLWYVQSQLYIFIRVFWIKVSGGWGSMTCMRWKVNAEMGLTQTADLNKKILELLFLKIPIEENLRISHSDPHVYSVWMILKESEIADLDSALIEACNAYDSLKRKVAKLAKWASCHPCYPVRKMIIGPGCLKSYDLPMKQKMNYIPFLAW